MGLYGFTGYITGPRIKGPYWGPTVPSLEVQANVKQFRSSMQAAGFKLSGHESFTQLLGAALGSSLLPSLVIAVVPIFTDSFTCHLPNRQVCRQIRSRQIANNAALSTAYLAKKI